MSKLVISVTYIERIKLCAENFPWNCKFQAGDIVPYVTRKEDFYSPLCPVLHQKTPVVQLLYLVSGAAP